MLTPTVCGAMTICATAAKMHAAVLRMNESPLEAAA